MRVSIVTESFLPNVNGVTNSVLRMVEHLTLRGHQCEVVTPIAGESSHGDIGVIRLPALPMPRYPQVAISLASTSRLTSALRSFKPDVVHLASPFVVGPPAVRAARSLGLPVVASFQTDVAGFANHYGLALASRWVWHRLRTIHQGADRNLAPSRPTIEQLSAHGIPRLSLWPRGVDTFTFNPCHRDETLHRQWSGDDRSTVVGYVGRLAAEKEVSQLEALADQPGIRLVLIGDGPERASLQRRIPNAVFTGFLHGAELSRAIASLDVMVHTGRHETFCQAVHESMASGVPVVAPAAGGPLDLIDASRTGWLYRPGDTDDLRERVRDLAGDAYKRRAMGEAARISVARRTWPSVMAALETHYDQLLAGGGHATLQEAG